MRRQLEEGRPGAAVLFEHDLVDELLWKSVYLEPGGSEELDTSAPVMASAFHTGHLLGACGFLIEAPSGGLAYTGDFCGHGRELHEGMVRPPVAIDTLIVEGTYGATAAYQGADYPREVERFAADVEAVLARGGSVLIPTFALGRTQEMLALIKRLCGQRRLPRTPLYVSGLGRTFSEIHDRQRRDPWLRRFRWKFEASAEVLENGHLADPARLLRDPAIYLLTSGMMIEGTLSARMAELMVRDPRHAIFFVGYVDPSELGHRVLHAGAGDWLEFRRAAPMTQVQTRNIRRYYFSAHADREEILELIDDWDPKHVVLVHGDEPALEWLKQQILERSGGGRRVSVPQVGSRIAL